MLGYKFHGLFSDICSEKSHEYSWESGQRNLKSHASPNSDLSGEVKETARAVSRRIDSDRGPGGEGFIPGEYSHAEVPERSQYCIKHLG